MNEPQPALTDPRPTFALIAAQAQKTIEQVQEGDLGRPTPCDDFDVHRLLGHLVGVTARMTHVGNGGYFADVDTMFDVELADVPARFAAGSRTAIEAWADDAKLGAPFSVPWGDVPGAGVVAGYNQEVLMHTWDLADAIGFDGLDPALAEAILPISMQFVPAEIRVIDEVPFGPVVDVPEDADPYLRLAGWLGRRPLALA